MVFGPEQVTTGAAQDFAQATELARRMITKFGMSDALGPVNIVEGNNLLPYPGQELHRRHEISERTAELIDEEIRQSLTEALVRARDLIRENLDKLHALARGLLERETLDRSALSALMAGQPLPPLATAPGPAESPGAAPDSLSEPALAGAGTT